MLLLAPKQKEQIHRYSLVLYVCFVPSWNGKALQRVYRPVLKMSMQRISTTSIAAKQMGMLCSAIPRARRANRAVYCTGTDDHKDFIKLIGYKEKRRARETA